MATCSAYCYMADKARDGGDMQAAPDQSGTLYALFPAMTLNPSIELEICVSMPRLACWLVDPQTAQGCQSLSATLPSAQLTTLQ